MDLTSPAKRQSRTASFSTATVVEGDLVSSLWQHLPAELLEKILSKLPLSALRKFSRVSKRWKALFRSVEFARECDSIEWTFFYLDLCGEVSDMLYPNLKTNSWDKISLDFLLADEWIVDFQVVADGGLLCYRIHKQEGFDPSTTLVVHNPLTRKWRHLTVPHQLERDLPGYKILWALMVDKETGSYKVLVAFCDEYLCRKAFIYDSVLTSWSISAALTPVLFPRFEKAVWKVRNVVCSNGELLWLIEETDVDPRADGFIYKWLITYNFELDAWISVTQQSPHLYEEQVHLVHDDIANRPVSVNVQEFRPGMPNSWDIPSSERFPAELLELVPNLGKVGIEDIEHLVNGAGVQNGHQNSNPTKWLLVAEPGTLYRLYHLD